MSTAFSKRMQGVGTRLLTKFGSTVSLVRAGSKVWDEVLGEYVWSADEVLPLRAVPVPVNAGLVNGVVTCGVERNQPRGINHYRV
jgi:hypothetical protein